MGRAPVEESIESAGGAESAIVEARDVVQEFVVRDRAGSRGGVVQAVSGVSLSVRSGETLGVVGETGSGKSTLARSIMQAPRPKTGSVLVDGEDLTRLRGRALIEKRRSVQMVFQDPHGSLDPRWSIGRIVEEPLRSNRVGRKGDRHRRASELLDRVGLDPSVYAGRKPRELSGGQAQRVAIARALALEPRMIICDEAVSALDVQVQAQVLNLFEDLRDENQLAYLFISHDLALVKQVSDRVAVMYLGKLCEVAPAAELYRAPRHPYTVALLAAIPDASARFSTSRVDSVIRGEPPSPLDPPSGCRFRTRCPRARDECAEEVPVLRDVAAGHTVACHFPVTPE